MQPTVNCDLSLANIVAVVADHVDYGFRTLVACVLAHM